MNKKTLLILVLSFSISSFSQEKITNFKNYLKTSTTGIKEVIPIVNEKNNDISLFILDATKIYGYVFNENFEITNQLSSEDRSRKYKTLIGNSITDTNDYRVYLANNKRNKFASINFSYETNTSSFKEFSLRSKDEKFIQTAVFENRFYLFSILKNSSIINVYSFDDKGDYVIHKVDFSKDRFINSNSQSTSLYKLLTVSSGAYGLGKTVDINKIDKNSPNSIEVTSESRKLYLRDQKIVFSFDLNGNFSQVISIDLLSFEKEIKRFKKPMDEIQSHFKKTNSYIHGEQIYVVAATSKKFKFAVLDFETGDLIREYSATENDSISFKNTPIIQKGGMYDSYRELERTKKFLRKITTGDIGISVHKTYRGYQISIGSKLEQRSAGMAMPMGGFGMPIASVGAVSVYFNPAYFAYNSYSNTKSTYIKCLFDVDFKHMQGEVNGNAFDKIKEFSEKLQYDSPKAKTVFKYKDYYILGNYFPEFKEYKLIKFKG